MTDRERFQLQTAQAVWERAMKMNVNAFNQASRERWNAIMTERVNELYEKGDIVNQELAKWSKSNLFFDLDP